MTSKSAAEDPAEVASDSLNAADSAECRDERGNNLVAGSGRRISGPTAGAPPPTKTFSEPPTRRSPTLHATRSTSFPETDSLSTAANFGFRSSPHDIDDALDLLGAKIADVTCVGSPRTPAPTAVRGFRDQHPRTRVPHPASATTPNGWVSSSFRAIASPSMPVASKRAASTCGSGPPHRKEPVSVTSPA
nr:hypothetical protein [Rhodococcus erythropolis]